MPNWDGEFWSGDSQAQAVVIRHPGSPERKIACSDPAFDDGVWLSNTSLNCLYQQIVMNCKEFKTLKPSCKPIKPEVMKAALHANGVGK